MLVDAKLIDGEGLILKVFVDAEAIKRCARQSVWIDIDELVHVNVKG